MLLTRRRRLSKLRRAVRDLHSSPDPNVYPFAIHHGYIALSRSYTEELGLGDLAVRVETELRRLDVHQALELEVPLDLVALEMVVRLGLH